MTEQTFDIRCGDCREVLKSLPDNSVDSIVTDPPYGLSFMGRKWDYDVPSVEIWAECLRVLKPGGHLLAFAGTRTQHRMACRIDDAGFEIRDMIAWIYGSGFPKAQSCLKPALEPITLARKAAAKATPLNIDACRVPFDSEDDEAESKGKNQHADHGNGARQNNVLGDMGQNVRENYDAEGRWPANVIHDGSQEVIALFPQSNGAGWSVPKTKVTGYGSRIGTGTSEYTPDQRSAFSSGSGSAARFFYCAKASRADRNEGLFSGDRPAVGASATMREREDADWSKRNGNHHPTVKPTDLMAYLCRLVTQPGGTVLDPFMGSGSTGKAAIREGFNFIGIEREAEYVEIAEARCRQALVLRLREQSQRDMFGGDAA